MSKAERTLAWFRWITAVVVAVAVSLVIVSTTVRDAELEGCERGQVIFEKMAVAMEVAAVNSETVGEASNYRLLAAGVRNEIVNCDDAYPPPIPFVE